MKRLFSLMLAVLLLFSALPGCSKEDLPSADDPITISVSLGSGQVYYENLRELVRENLGIELEFVYQAAYDTTNSIIQEFRNNDLPADIMVTGSAVPSEYLAGSCLDLMESSVLMNNFTYSTLEQYTADDGAIYELPFNSRLIGITINETLLQELGCDYPETFQDMVDLKEICDGQGIEFAVSGGVAAGHGFNWLFHLMGAQWLSGPDGTDWFESYLEGNTTVDRFAEEAEYFKKYAEAGLFGSFHNQDWNASTEYRTKRALILYDLTNSLYRNYRLNEDGTIYGAEYDADGNVIAVADPDGAFVKSGDSWVLYDENNLAHRELERYEIPGSSIDTFRSIPWISEDGSTNTYTVYDSLFLMVNRKLGEKGQEERLEKVLSVLEYMTTEDVTSMFTASTLDGYIAVRDFEFTEDRMYAADAEKIKNGYTQPWYYLWVDNETLVSTGNAANAYLAGEGTYEDIIAALDTGVQSNRNSVKKVLTTVTEDFTFEEMARLLAVAGAQDLSGTLEEAGITDEVTASLMPYTEKRGDLVPWSVSFLGVVSTTLYHGEFEESYLNTLLPNNALSPCAIYMTSSELSTILEEGLDRSQEAGYEKVVDSYPYVCVTSDGSEPDEDTEEMYLVAVNRLSLSDTWYTYFLEQGRIIMNPEDTEKPLTGTLRDGLLDWFHAHEETSPSAVVWE